jgi:hypothetical protein
LSSVLVPVHFWTSFSYSEKQVVHALAVFIKAVVKFKKCVSFLVLRYNRLTGTNQPETKAAPAIKGATIATGW